MTDLRTSPELRDELKATLRTRQELGEEMEDEVIESFLGRLQGSIEDRVDARVEETLRRQKRSRSSPSIGLVAVVLCFNIPLLAIAAGLAGPYGVLGVLALDIFILVKR